MMTPKELDSLITREKWFSYLYGFMTGVIFVVILFVITSLTSGAK